VGFAAQKKTFPRSNGGTPGEKISTLRRGRKGKTGKSDIERGESRIGRLQSKKGLRLLEFQRKESLRKPPAKHRKVYRSRGEEGGKVAVPNKKEKEKTPQKQAAPTVERGGRGMVTGEKKRIASVQ